MLALNGKPICIPCADAKAKEAGAVNSTLEFAHIIDPTICGICKTDFGNSDLALVGGTPACSNCAAGLYERPYPGWLRMAMAGLLLLLAGSLWRGLPYFKAGRHLVVAERAMDHRDYKRAAIEFTEVLKVSPSAQRVVLEGAKADLMSGDVEGAGKFLKQRLDYERNDLFTEVNGMWDHALGAFKKAQLAAKLAEADKNEEAARLMHEASNEYPQSPDLAISALALDGFVAFDHKDYDTFLRLAQAQLASRPDDPRLAGGVASALACKYAVTGDQTYRNQAEEILSKARTQAQRSPEQKADFDEYVERINYRLDTRIIIDKKEYDRRFRNKGEKH